MDAETDIIKSLIYGNQVRNPYGNFRSFCAALAQIEQIDTVMHFLKTNDKFRRYNRFTYAYRVYEFQQFFVTEDKQPGLEVTQNRILEGFKEDETLEGTGEKLLHLLQKFNVENVIVITAIEQYNPLNNFELQHYRIVVERCKDLLNNLYIKVVQQEEEENNKQIQTHSVVKVLAKLPKTQLDVPATFTQAKFSKIEDKQNNRPGHFYAENPAFKVVAKGTQPLPAISDKKKINTLNQRLMQTAFQLQKLLESLGEKEYLQIRFLVKYDQNKLIDKVFELLMLIFDVPGRDALATDFDFKDRLENMTVNDLNNAKVRKINENLRGDKRLNAYNLASINPLISTIFSFIVLLVKTYEIGKDIIKLTTNIVVEQKEKETTQ